MGDKFVSQCVILWPPPNPYCHSLCVIIAAAYALIGSIIAEFTSYYCISIDPTIIVWIVLSTIPAVTLLNTLHFSEILGPLKKCPINQHLKFAKKKLIKANCKELV